MKNTEYRWIEIIGLLLPFIIQIIQQCFPQPESLRAFAYGERTRNQEAGLYNRCCQLVIQATGWNWFFRGFAIRRAALVLQREILAELDAMAGKPTSPGGPPGNAVSDEDWANAFSEAQAS
jgi:hypothetical protein